MKYIFASTFCCIVCYAHVLSFNIAAAC